MVPSRLFSFMVVCSLSVISVTAKETEIVDSGRFERWSHFKDYGVPGTVNDPVNKAAIADGTCRLLEQRNGFFMWRDGNRTQRVIDALAAAPRTDQPSHFVLETAKSLQQACFDDSGEPAVRPDYDVKVVASSMQNWYHALCAPEEDPSWKGMFDPAYQPQQMALTAGFMCIAACDAKGNEGPSEDTMARLSDSSGAAQASRDQVCNLFTWGTGIDFSTARQLSELAKLTQPLTHSLCQCGKGASVIV